MAQPLLDGLELVALLIDGVHIGEHCLFKEIGLRVEQEIDEGRDVRILLSVAKRGFNQGVV